MAKRAAKARRIDLARRIEYGSEIGYRTTRVDGAIRVEPINLELQGLFEATLVRLREK